MITEGYNQQHRLAVYWKNLIMACKKDPTMTICTQWWDFRNFTRDLDSGFSKGCKLTHIDKVYSPLTSGWLTPKLKKSPTNNRLGVWWLISDSSYNRFWEYAVADSVFRQFVARVLCLNPNMVHAGVRLDDWKYYGVYKFTKTTYLELLSIAGENFNTYETNKDFR